MPQLVAAPDKFIGAATAAEVADAIGRAARANGWDVHLLPMADGSEGFLDALGGKLRQTTVQGPLGNAVQAEWRWLGGGRKSTAVIEMARASGLELVGGAKRNDALKASSAGTGELIMRAIQQGARRVIVGCGGSATTDGGWGAVSALRPVSRLAGVELIVACDVTIKFEEAAAVFAAEKGASHSQKALLGARLRRLSQLYQEASGIDIASLEGSGAGGGLAGGLVSVGAKLMRGFDLVAELTGLADYMAAADLVLTGERYVDAQSFDGKVVGGVTALASENGIPVVVIAEHSEHGPWPSAFDLLTVEETSTGDDTSARIERVVADYLRSWAIN